MGEYCGDHKNDRVRGDGACPCCLVEAMWAANAKANELSQKLESAHREILDLRRLMGHWSTVELALKAREAAELQVESLRKALFEILGTVQGSHPSPYLEIQALAKAALGGVLDKRKCEKCGKPATFACAGSSDQIPARLYHPTHYSCDECDKGIGCAMIGERIR